MPRITPLLAFREPTVKAGDVVLSVLGGSGEWSDLQAPRDLMRALGRALLKATRPAHAARTARPARRVGRAPLLKPKGALL